jgi:hypothetical protein
VAALHASAAGRQAAAAGEQVLARLKDACQSAGAPDAAALQRCVEAVAFLEAEDRRFMREMKLGLRAGVQVFERRERDTLTGGALPGVFEGYLERVAAGWEWVQL